MEDLYKSFWKKQKENSSKLYFYNKKTENYELQPYLTLKINKKHVVAMCKLRISAHDLMIEKGRYTNVQRQDRLCNYCDEVEDEYHFLDRCIMYKKQRNETLAASNITYKTLSDYILQDDKQRQIARYIFEAFKVRSSKVSAQ